MREVIRAGFAVLLVAVLTGSAACNGRDRREAAAAESRTLALPPIGIALDEGPLTWCAEFSRDAMTPAVAPGRMVSIVFPGEMAVASVAARIVARRSEDCDTAFPQPRWTTYVAHELELLDSIPAGEAVVPLAALVVASDARWSRGSDGVVRVDLDGDGVSEEARRCTADEGEHFTVWSIGRDGSRARRWHEYFDWGAFTDPTCRPGEDGQDHDAGEP